MPFQSITSARSSRQRGFTLIEMLVSISITLIITGGVMVSYRGFNQRQQLIQSTKNLQQTLRLAQKKARVGEKPTGCQTLEGYTVRGTINSQNVALLAICDLDTEYPISTTTLSGNTLLDVTFDFTYKVLTGGVIGAGPVQLSNADLIYTFNVNPGGDISEGQYVE